jgi:acyl-CoA synthetase (AMP-forming)/AMP-acid ligase II/aryl carrier-like protein
LSQLLGELKTATVVHAVPTLMKEIIGRIKEENGESRGYGNIEKVFVGGELVPWDLLEELSSIFNEARIDVLYGPTEGTIICTSYTVGSSEVGRKNIIGGPLDNTKIRACDEHGELVPIGVRGELRIGGEGVARGYLNRPELTAERFIPDAYSPESGARVYRTGDLGRFGADGKIEFLGRNDDQIKVRGYRIEPKEIEAVLDDHPSVKESVVVAREDQRGGKRLLGYVVGEEGLTTTELKRHVRERLPEYMAPSAMVVLEQMPLLPNGKVDRRALPAPDGAGADREYEAPVGATEAALAQIWAEMLKLERVGRHDHFFELGGHSLLAVRLIERMRREGLHGDVRALFATPTLTEFAAATEDMEVVL